MEGVSTKVYKGLKGYWRRRGYERISGSGRRRNTPAVELGSGGSTRRKRVWSVKINRKIKLKCLFVSPKKFLIGIRDAYMRMMMRLANSRAVGVSGYGSGFGGEACFVTRPRPVKEYDEKVVVELYKKILMGRNQMVHPDGSEMVLRRVFEYCMTHSNCSKLFPEYPEIERKLHEWRKQQLEEVIMDNLEDNSE